MSPKEENNGKIVIDFPLPKKEFPDRQREAILELSSLLGFKPETLIIYFEIRQSNDFEERFFSSRLRSRFQVIKRSQLESNEEILLSLGLDSYNSKAFNYVTSSCSLEDNHLDIIDWTVLYMQDLMRNSLFLENVYGKFPHQESIVNKWFKHSVKQEDGSNREVNLLNKSEKKHKKNDPYPSLDGKCFPDGMNEDGYELFYHGTDHESAANIIEKGIDLEKGGEYKDFSHGIGFYLNNSYQEAWLWTFQRKSKPAVLSFKVPTKVLDGFRQQSINLVANESEWERITRSFRFFNPKDKEFKKEMKRISFIEGPIASVAKRDSELKFKGVIEGSYQMCLHSFDLAERFDSCLHSVVFF